MTKKLLYQASAIFLALLAAIAFGAGQTWAAVSPPDLEVCEGVECEGLPYSVCSDAGFKITMKDYTPASTANSGTATYVFEICSPVAGTCNSTVRPGESCQDHSFCQEKGQNEDPNARCLRECATDVFRALSHFDVTFPALGGSKCLSENTQVTGSCTNGNFVLGDASCFDNNYPVAKCDGTNLGVGSCFTMTLNIAGETNSVGLGAAIVVDKEATTCTASCLAGPSCDDCTGTPPGSQCLTRTIGFWGTHPHIAGLYDPVTVCGLKVDGQNANACSTSEALCTSSNDYKQNPTYLSFVAQLTAAKLNLNATAGLFGSANCSTWRYQGKSIQQLISDCESANCNARKQSISVSGCIAALTAFNESQDTGFDVTPSPFDKPGPASIEQCQRARSNGKYIGAAGGLGCANP